MALEAFDHVPLRPEDFDVYHTMAVIKVPAQFQISFESSCPSDIMFDADVDRFNFTEMKVGERLATIDPDKDIYLNAIDEQGRDVSSRYFKYKDGEITTQIPVMPSMLTTKEEIIRQDCLCYMMEKIELVDDLTSK